MSNQPQSPATSPETLSSQGQPMSQTIVHATEKEKVAANAPQEDTSTDSDSISNKESQNTSVYESTAQESNSTHSHTDDFEITCTSHKEPESAKAKQDDELFDIELHQQTTKSTASSLPHVSKESTSAEYIPSSNKTKILCGKPGKPRATNITSGCIEIEWAKPEQNTWNVTAYTILYRSVSDLSDQWSE